MNVDLNVHYPCTSPLKIIETHMVMILLYCPWSLCYHYGDTKRPYVCMLIDSLLGVRGLVQSPCGKINVIMTLGGERVLVHDV